MYRKIIDCNPIKFIELEHNTNFHMSYFVRQEILTVCDILKIREQDFLDDAVEPYLVSCERQIASLDNYEEERYEDAKLS
jgi:hypothetical protein